jgi:hypothetical protein
MVAIASSRIAVLANVVPFDCQKEWSRPRATLGKARSGSERLPALCLGLAGALSTRWLGRLDAFDQLHDGQRRVVGDWDIAAP